MNLKATAGFRKYAGLTRLALATVLSVGAVAAATVKVPLESGREMVVTTIPYSRLLPHAYYDQAMASLPALHPDLEVLVKRRFGLVGEVAYCLIVYKTEAGSEEIVFDGAVQRGSRAWQIRLLSPDKELANTLMEVLELISRLPSHELLKETKPAAPEK